MNGIRHGGRGRMAGSPFRLIDCCEGINMKSFCTTLYPAYVLLLIALPCSAFAQEGKPAEKWEYGELRHYERAGTSANLDNVFRSAIDWISAEGFVRSYGWPAMADKLKAPELKRDLVKNAEKDELEAIHRLRFLNHLGDQGWELVAHQRNERGESLWIFKRRVGK
jgi:hypothetical protein